MEMEQMQKQIDWLDEEHRKTKTAIELQEKKIVSVQGDIQPLFQQIKDLGGEITRVTAILARIDQFDEAVLQLRIETKQALDALDKQLRKREDEVEKVRRVELRVYDEGLEELRKEG